MVRSRDPRRLPHDADGAAIIGAVVERAILDERRKEPTA
jgi:hypothetical protein